MIRSIRTKNFLSHRDTVLDFCEGVNVIVGQSQNGKSACSLKPLQLIAYNRPLGGGYLSNFCGDSGTAEIHLEFDNGWVNLKKKIRTNKEGKKEVIPNGTVYELSNGNAFSDLSDQVTELIDMSDLNIQDQTYRDSGRPFLITDTPGEIARKINRITRLDRADEWVSELTSRVNDSNSEIKKLKADKEGKEKQLSKYADIDKTEVIVAKVGKLETEITNKGSELEAIAEVKENILLIDKELKLLEGVFSVEEYVEELEELLKNITDKQKQLILMQDFIVCDCELSLIKEYIDNAEGEVNAISLIKEEIDSYNEELFAIGRYLKSEQDLEQSIRSKNAVEEMFRGLLKKTGKCYVCFSDLDDDRIGRILEEI